ncbi:MAG: 50S ribosomal protein L24 [Candidatus Komeilibacteria bacterium]|nr:50S ribosomal protein L24 [Candidatus Komeilibacteria bacterium]
MIIKKGDTVRILAGKDRGKSGKVLQAFPELARVSVAGINITFKHLRKPRQGQTGQKIEFPSPLRVSNVILVCPHCGKDTRVSKVMSADGKRKERLCKKCKGVI